MSEIREGTAELHMKVKGVHYAFALELSELSTKKKLDRGLKWLDQCLCITLKDLGWFKEQS